MASLVDASKRGFVKNTSLSRNSEKGSNNAATLEDSVTMIPNIIITGAPQSLASPAELSSPILLTKEEVLEPTISINDGIPADKVDSGLWQQAYDNLTNHPDTSRLMTQYREVLRKTAEELTDKKGERARLDTQQEIQEVVTRSLNRMTKKQWVLQWGEKRIIIRDQAERIVKLVKLFSAFGTTAATLDPLHAGLPWAGVCVLLPVCGNGECSKFEANICSLYLMIQRSKRNSWMASKKSPDSLPVIPLQRICSEVAPSPIQ
jgi:hypothetical protein